METAKTGIDKPLLQIRIEEADPPSTKSPVSSMKIRNSWDNYRIETLHSSRTHRRGLSLMEWTIWKFSKSNRTG